MTLSFGGLVSGLDTASLINQLMQVEAIPQQRLAQRARIEQSEVTALQGLNTKLAALTGLTEDLAEPDGWAPMRATSSSEHVTATAKPGAAVTTLSFTVDRTAVAHRLAFTTTAALTDRVTNADSTAVRLTASDGTVTEVDSGDGTLRGLVTAINNADAGVRATTIRLDDGTYRLHVTASETGTASSFTLTNADGSELLGGATVTLGRDAAVTVGTDTIHSASNTFSGVVTGLDFTVTEEAVGSTVDVATTRDTGSMRDSVKKIVDEVNAALRAIGTATAPGVNGRAGGLLAGDSTLRLLRSDLLSTVTGGVGGKTLADVGIEVDRNGTVTFDVERFESALAADPAATTAMFTGPGGFVIRVGEVAEAASDSTTGSLTLAIKGRGTSIDRMEDSIADWNNRLELRRQSLNRQYAALEVALGQLQNQSSWLAGQIGGLPKISSGQ